MSQDQSQDSNLSDISDISSFARWEEETGEKILDERKASRLDMANMAILRVWTGVDSSNDAGSSDEEELDGEELGVEVEERVGKKIEYTRATSVSSSSTSEIDHPPSSQPRPADSESENEDDPLADFDVDPEQREYMRELLDVAPEEELTQLSQHSLESKKITHTMLEEAHGQGMRQLSQLSQASPSSKKDKKRKRKSEDVKIGNVVQDAMAVVAAGIAGHTGEGFPQAIEMATENVKKIAGALEQESAKITMVSEAEAATCRKSRKKRRRQGNNANINTVKDVAPILEAAADWYQSDDATAMVIDTGDVEEVSTEDSVSQKIRKATSLEAITLGSDDIEGPPANKPETEDKYKLKRAAKRAAKKAQKAKETPSISKPIKTAQVSEKTVQPSNISNKDSASLGDAKNKNAARKAARKAKKAKLGPTTSKFFPPAPQATGSPGPVLKASPEERRNKKLAVRKAAANSSDKVTTKPIAIPNPEATQAVERPVVPKKQEKNIRKLAKELKLPNSAVKLLLKAKQAVENSVNNPLPGTTTRPTYSGTTTRTTDTVAGSSNATPEAKSKTNRRKRNKKTRNHNTLKEEVTPVPVLKPTVITRPVFSSTPYIVSDQQRKTDRKAAQRAASLAKNGNVKAQDDAHDAIEVDSAPGNVEKPVVEKSEQKGERRSRGRKSAKGKNEGDVSAEAEVEKAVEPPTTIADKIKPVEPEIEESEKINKSKAKRKEKKRKSLSKDTGIPETQDSLGEAGPRTKKRKSLSKEPEVAVAEKPAQEEKPKKKKRKSLNGRTEIPETQETDGERSEPLCELTDVQSPSKKTKENRRKSKQVSPDVDVEMGETSKDHHSDIYTEQDNIGVGEESGYEEWDGISDDEDVGMDVDGDGDEENVPASGEEIQPHTPFENRTLRAPVGGGSGHEFSILGSQRKASEAELYISPRQLRERSKPLNNSQSPRKPFVIIPFNEERERSEELNEEVPIASVEITPGESPPSHSKRELARRRTMRGKQEDKEPTPAPKKTPKKVKYSAKERPRKSILERELGIVIPSHEEQEEAHEEPMVSVERTPQTSKVARQRGPRKLASEQDEDKETTLVVETPSKKIKCSSRKERPRKSILERELGIVPLADEDEDEEPTPAVEVKSLDMKERPRRSILERELGIVPSADKDSSGLHEESHNRRTSSVASDRITRQAEFEAAPINVFDRYLGESDVELPKPRRSSDTQVYVKKEGYKRLVGVLSRYPTSDDESVFDPSEARRRTNSTPFRDAKGQFIRKGSSSAVKPKSEDKKREAPRSLLNIASVPSPESESPPNFSDSSVRSIPLRRLFNNKSEIPCSSTEEESASEIMGSQQDMESIVNKKITVSSSSNRFPVRPRNPRVYTARIPHLNAGSILSNKFDSGSIMPKSSPPTISANTEERMKSPSTDLPSRMLSNTSRKRDSASISSLVVMRMKRNKAADFFDLYDDYQPRSPPPSSDVSFQGEPGSMTLCGDTQLPVEEELASTTILGVSQSLGEEPGSTTIHGDNIEKPESMEFPWDIRMPDLRTVLRGTQLPVEEEPESKTLCGDSTQLPVKEPSETAAAPQPYTESSIKSIVDALFHLASSCNIPDSSDSSYHTVKPHQEDLDLSQEAKLEVASSLKPSKKEKAKRQPAKSPYFKQLAESPKKKSKGKMAKIDGQEMPTTPKKESTSSPNKRSPSGFVSCIPFPPLSSPNFGLIQEKLAHDPFRLLIAVTFLNRTKGKQAIPVFYELVEKYPTPEALCSAPREDIVEIIRHLGLQNQRAETFQTYGKQWLEEPPMKDKRYIVKGYPKKDSGRDIERGEIVTDSDRHTEWEIGHMTQGPYAIDSWRIFCRDVLRGVADSWNGENAKGKNFQPEWMRVLPEDKELRAYLRWMWLKEGFHWDPFTGDKEVATSELMEAAMGRKGRIAWDDFGGMRIMRGGCG